MRLCLVVPSYRDSARLRESLPVLCEELRRLQDVGILVVDDGSGDAEAAATSALVQEIAGRFPGRVNFLALPANRGKGGAVYAGWDSSAESEWVGFLDADGATPAREAVRMIEHVFASPDECDACIGSRIRMMGRTVSRSVKRHVVGRVFATLTSSLVGLVVYDSQCGCKILKRSWYLKVRERLVETRFAFDIDLLANLARSGARIREFPVDWSDVPGSKVSLLKDGLQMFAAILRLRGRLGPPASESPNSAS